MIARKKSLFLAFKSPEEEKKRAQNLANLFYTFASNRPNNFGVYKVYASEEVNELLSHYENDLKEITEKPGLLDAAHLTRLAQALYILKTNDFESIFERIERRALELNEQGKLDVQNACDILRSFTHS